MNVSLQCSVRRDQEPESKPGIGAVSDSNKEVVRNEMFLHQGYYVTESSGPNSEYNLWFCKRPELIEKYCTHGTGWKPCEHAYTLKEYLGKEHMWKDEDRRWFEEHTSIDLTRSREFASPIINAWMDGEV